MSPSAMGDIFVSALPLAFAPGSGRSGVGPVADLRARHAQRAGRIAAEEGASQP